MVLTASEIKENAQEIAVKTWTDTRNKLLVYKFNLLTLQKQFNSLVYFVLTASFLFEMYNMHLLVESTSYFSLHDKKRFMLFPSLALELQRLNIIDLDMYLYDIINSLGFMALLLLYTNKSSLVKVQPTGLKKSSFRNRITDFIYNKALKIVAIIQLQSWLLFLAFVLGYMKAARSVLEGWPSLPEAQLSALVKAHIFDYELATPAIKGYLPLLALYYYCFFLTEGYLASEEAKVNKSIDMASEIVNNLVLPPSRPTE